MSRAIHIAFTPLLFSHWVGFEFMLVYAVFLAFSVVVISSVKGSIPNDSVLITLAFIVPVFFLIHSFSDVGVDNEYFVKYTYLYLAVFVLVALFLLSGNWGEDEFIRAGRLIFWVAFLTIFLEFIGVNFLGISKTHFPAVRYSNSYFADYMGWHRPFGLTGQPSVNGSILLLSYLFLSHLNIARLQHFLMLLLGVCLEISGQAILSTFFILSILYVRKHKSIKMRTGLLLLLSGLFLWVLNANISQKISMDYLLYTLVEKANAHTIIDLSMFHFLFGTLGMAMIDVTESTEVFLVESILRYGAVFTVFYWGFIWLLVRKTPMPVVWFMACFLTSLHYPTVYYIEAQLILGLLYVSTTTSGGFLCLYRSCIRS